MGLFDTERFPVRDHDDAVVDETVEQGNRGRLVGQEPAPFLEGPVAGDGDNSASIGDGDKAEQQLSAGVVARLHRQ